MTNITKIPLRTLLEDIGFEADNDEDPEEAEADIAEELDEEIDESEAE